VLKSTQDTVGGDGSSRLFCKRQSPGSRANWCVLQLTRRRTGLLVQAREWQGSVTAGELGVRLMLTQNSILWEVFNFFYKSS
jgi:hypothetical protein